MHRDLQMQQSARRIFWCPEPDNLRAGVADETEWGFTRAIALRHPDTFIAMAAMLR
jgi:hypothetical protein